MPTRRYTHDIVGKLAAVYEDSTDEGKKRAKRITGCNGLPALIRRMENSAHLEVSWGAYV